MAAGSCLSTFKRACRGRLAGPYSRGAIGMLSLNLHLHRCLLDVVVAIVCERHARNGPGDLQHLVRQRVGVHAHQVLRVLVVAAGRPVESDCARARAVVRETHGMREVKGNSQVVVVIVIRHVFHLDVAR